MANYTLNFDNAYADCFNVTLINLKVNADCIEYAFSITQITLNISKTLILILMEFLLILVTIILRLLLALLHGLFS